MDKFLCRILIAIMIIMGLSSTAFSQNNENEASREQLARGTAAREHLVRGMTAIERNKGENGMKAAVAEFKKATEIAPNMAAAWYNLGSAQVKTGEMKDAISSYQRYLTLAPQADNARRVRENIIKLEYWLQAGKIKAMAGFWITEDGTLFRMTVGEDNRMTLETNNYHLTDDEVFAKNSVSGKLHLFRPAKMTYTLAARETQLTGSWHREKFYENCSIPEEAGTLTGQWRSEREFVLRYAYTKFSFTRISAVRYGEDYCRYDRSERKEMEKKFFGPLPSGSTGIAIKGIYTTAGPWGNTKAWDGHPTIGYLEESSPGYAAGLRQGDEITAIDGAPVTTLSAKDGLSKLFGEPGSEVTLSIKDKPNVRLRRVTVTELKPGVY